MAHDPITDLWVVGYDNGGVDLKDAWGVTHLPDLRIAQVVGTKRVRDIVIYDGQALLSTGVGVVVVDLAKREISDLETPPSDTPVQARCVVQHEGQWLVGTDGGVFAGAVGDPFLANPDQWTPWEGAPELGPVLELQRFGGMWWMATETPEEGHAVVWRGNANALGCRGRLGPDGLEYGGMAAGDWVLQEGSPDEHLAGVLLPNLGFRRGRVSCRGGPHPARLRAHPRRGVFERRPPGPGLARKPHRRGGDVDPQPHGREHPSSWQQTQRASPRERAPHGLLERQLVVATGAVSASWTPSTGRTRR